MHHNTDSFHGDAISRIFMHIMNQLSAVITPTLQTICSCITLPSKYDKLIHLKLLQQFQTPSTGNQLIPYHALHNNFWCGYKLPLLCKSSFKYSLLYLNSVLHLETDENDRTECLEYVSLLYEFLLLSYPSSPNIQSLHDI